MEFIEYMPEYFKGEKGIAFYAIPIGLFFHFAAVSIWKLYWTNEIAKGLFFVLVLLGIASIGAGIFIHKKSETDIKKLTASHEENPIQTVDEEMARMAQVNANWIKLKIAWAVLLVIGMVIIFAIRNQIWVGVALGLLLIGVLGFLVDVFAERRAEIYTNHLQLTAESESDVN